MAYLAVAAHLFSLVGFVMAILLVARSAEQRRPAGSLFAWLFAILTVPYLGVPLYLLFGGRKLKTRAALKQKLRPRAGASSDTTARLSKMLSASGAAPPSRGNVVELLVTGEAAFAAICSAIDNARSSIDLSTLILADDETGRAIGAALASASARGVRVRVLIDALFKFRASRSLTGELVRAGVRIAWFMPIWSLMPRRSANLRLHRKVVVLDGQRAIVGGMNLAREYMGATPFEGRWRDLALLVTGPAARDIQNIFESDWQFASGDPIADGPTLAAPEASGAHGTETQPTRTALGSAETAPSPTQAALPAATAPRAPAEAEAAQDWIQVVGSGPDAESDRIYDALLSAAFEARERLWIATPYFVPDEALLRALILAVRRGVDVRVVVPRRSNHLTADLAGASYLRALPREGAAVRCFAPQMLHAKLVLVDADLALLGSANMDMRSLFLDYEIALVITSTTCAHELEHWFNTLFQSCVDLEPPTRARALLEPIARLLAPLE